jgi:hypothetical protein
MPRLVYSSFWSTYNNDAVLIHMRLRTKPPVSVRVSECVSVCVMCGVTLWHASLYQSRYDMF